MKTYRERICKKVRTENMLHYLQNRETMLEQRCKNYRRNRHVILDKER